MIAGRSIDRRSVTAWRLIAVAAALLWFAVAAVAQTFPALTGRIVDQANVISADARRTIEPKLVDLETKSGIQLVVATVNSLEGQEIEPYANALFRKWQLGEKTKNNGVLLLVAPKERRVRIEVGYGLEGTLPDTESAMVKLWTSEVEGRVMDECLQLFGAAGYSDEYPISKMYAFARFHRIVVGSSEVMRQIIAKSL